MKKCNFKECFKSCTLYKEDKFKSCITELDELGYYIDHHTYFQERERMFITKLVDEGLIRTLTLKDENYLIWDILTDDYKAIFNYIPNKFITKEILEYCITRMITAPNIIYFKDELMRLSSKFKYDNEDYYKDFALNIIVDLCKWQKVFHPESTIDYIVQYPSEWFTKNRYNKLMESNLCLENYVWDTFYLFLSLKLVIIEDELVIEIIRQICIRNLIGEIPNMIPSIRTKLYNDKIYFAVEDSLPNCLKRL